MTPAFLLRLLQTRGFLGRTGPEDGESLKLGLALRAAALELRLKCIFCHPPLELMRGRPQDALAAAQGAIEGTSDYLFLARERSLAIEMKSANGRQTSLQKDFETWCDLVGVPYYVARSADQALSILSDYGLLV